MNTSPAARRATLRRYVVSLAILLTSTAAQATAPTLTPIGNQTVREGAPLNIALNASDDDGDTVTFTTNPSPPTGFCALSDVNPGDNAAVINCNPGAGASGLSPYGVIVTATDNSVAAEFTSESFNITVTANTAPVLTLISNQNVVEGGSINIPLSSSDADGDTMSFANTILPGFCSLNDGNGSGSIDCNPSVGDAGAYPINVIVTDNAPIPLQDSDPFTLTVGANQPPTASGVVILGTPALGQTLTGDYTYFDAEGDLEGTSTYRWLRNGAPIPNQTAITYTVVGADIGANLRFEVTPAAATGASPGAAAQSGDVNVGNTAPVITGQNVIQINEDTSRQIVLGDIQVTDPEVPPQVLTLSVGDGANYTRIGGPTSTTIQPDLNFFGDLSVPVSVNDGTSGSNVFDLVVTVLPVNDPPSFGGVQPPGLSTDEDTTLTIVIGDLVINDPDNVVPDEISLNIQPGQNYTIGGQVLNGAQITPAANFNGQLNVNASVSDGALGSGPFQIPVAVASINDLPVLEAPIGSQTIVEDAPFVIDISGNFSDADGEQLQFQADFVPNLPPGRNVNFDENTGVFSGTPNFAPNDPEDPVFQVTVTATDGDGESVSDVFDLTISQLGRANLGLTISATPENALPNNPINWTFRTDNPVGPVAGENVELTGSFIGNGLTVGVVGGANCAINTQGGRVDFDCVVGTVPQGNPPPPISFTTSANQATEIVAFGTSAGAQRVPIDPNPANNSDTHAVGVAESFSIGALQVLGSATVRSVTSGDVNGDGTADLIIGTASGFPVQVYIADMPRESCQCQRDFLSSPIQVPDTGSNNGVALGDFNEDGALDLVVVNGGGQPDRVYRNDGNGNFSLMATLNASNGNAVAVGDFDNDGDEDIAVAASSPNPVYFGNGNGGFGAPTLLGDADSFDVAVGRFDNNNRDDLVFANVGGPSQAYTKNSGGGFSLSDNINIGDAVAVAAADLTGDGLDDLVFGRVPTQVGDIPSNPVLNNNGGGNFGNPDAQLGISPTNDVLIGEVDGLPGLDLVFVNASGVHQIWNSTGGGYALHAEQIIDGEAMAGVLNNLGEVANGNGGGFDLAIGGALNGGVGVYLNDAAGNLGRGDTEPPVITLQGAASVSTPAGSQYIDAGASAVDNIDGNIVPLATNTVNTSVTGNYTVTYNVTDFAGNAATPVVRTVTVTPASGRGGGGGGAIGWFVLALLIGVQIMLMARQRPRAVRIRTRTGKNSAKDD